ncbi:MAG: hypothetical protein KC609_10300 [Myxococcales bacterium]|nr:hypothetical protein [Myxococcales bacterium]
MSRIGVVTNPNARKNRADRERIARITSILGDQGVVRETRTLEELPATVDEMAREGVRFWVGDGGDGTLHWLMNTALAQARSAGAQQPLMVPTNGGTIDFVAKKAGIHGSAEVILRSLVNAERRQRPFPVRHLDSLEFRGETLDGDPFHRIGFVSALTGIGQRFFDKLYQYDHAGASSIVRVLAKIIASWGINATPLHRLDAIPSELKSYGYEVFQRTRATVSVDGEALPWSEFGELSVGAIDINLGGVVRFFPRASEPGTLHFQGGYTSLKEAVINVPRMIAGQPIRGAGLTDGSFRELCVDVHEGDALHPVIDGEQFRNLKRLVITAGPKIAVPAVTH